MITVTIHQAKTHLSRLVREVQRGEAVLILHGTTPVDASSPSTPPRLSAPPSASRPPPA